VDKRIKRFQCDPVFHPYIEKALNRLPEEVREDILNDDSLQIVGGKYFLTHFGLRLSFDTPIRSLVYLNSRILKKPETDIIYTIAHEIAHHIAKEGKTGLHEKQAEDLLVEWGFDEEVKKVDYHRPILESAGYNAGYSWASKQSEDELLEKFGEFYDEWNEGRLTPERYEQLQDIADPLGIFMTEREEAPEAEEEQKPILDDGSLDKGVIGGIMGRLKESKKARINDIGPDMAEIIDTLERIDSLFKKFYSLGTLKYIERSHELGIGDLFRRVNELLQEIKEDNQS